MEITTQKFKRCDLLAVKGKVDSYTTPDLIKAIETLNNANRYKIILDLSQLELMSSAGFRGLLQCQKNCKRYQRGEIVFASVPKIVMEAIKLIGFTPIFKIFDEPISAVGYF